MTAIGCCRYLPDLWRSEAKITINCSQRVSPLFGIYRWSPTYNGLTFNFLTLQWCEGNRHSLETILWIFNFDLFPDQWHWPVTYSHASGQRQRASAASEPCCHWGKWPGHCALCCQHFLDIRFCVFTSRHVHKMPTSVPCFWCEEGGTYSWDDNSLAAGVCVFWAGLRWAGLSPDVLQVRRVKFIFDLTVFPTHKGFIGT